MAFKRLQSKHNRSMSLFFGTHTTSVAQLVGTEEAATTCSTILSMSAF